MALQFLYSSWQEDGAENTLFAYSEGLSEADRAYLLEAALPPNDTKAEREDEENKEQANTLFLRLPSGRFAIARFGIYTPKNTMQSQNRFLHAFVTDGKEPMSPMLYAINNCFRNTLTAQEQQLFRNTPFLPNAPFPRPQFKLSQPEIRKFFSAGRLRTLTCLLQAVIDSYGNERVIFLNDRFSSLKYWFYGIHCCLPRTVKYRLTYATYAFSKPEDCKLICLAPGSGIDGSEEIENGNFVFDNTGGVACEDVESAKYARSIAALFLENAGEAHTVARGIGRLMDAYQLLIPTAAGIYKLLRQDFDWFESPYDIQFFLGKIGAISKMHLESLSELLWEKIRSPGFRFPAGEKLLPLIAFLFKNLSSKTKREVVLYIGSHRSDFGIRETESSFTYYELISDKIGFVFEYISESVLEEEKDIDALIGRTSVLDRCVLLYLIADNWEEKAGRFGRERVLGLCYRFASEIIADRAIFAVREVCRRLAPLSEDFLHHTIVQAMLDTLNETEKNGASYDPSFTFVIVKELIGKPAVAADLIKMYARNGQYTDEVLDLYLHLCRNYPHETAVIDGLLTKKPVYAAFLTDMAIRKFLFLGEITRDKLTFFFEAYYLAGKDRERVFEIKLKSFLNGLLPVRRIETAEYFLVLYIEKSQGKSPEEALSSMSDSLADLLFSAINDHTVRDLFDYYVNAPEEYRKTGKLLSAVRPLSPAYEAAGWAVDLQKAAACESERDFDRALARFRSGEEPYKSFLGCERVTGEFIDAYGRCLFSFLARGCAARSDFFPIVEKALLPLTDKPFFEKELAAFLRRGAERTDTPYPFVAALLLSVAIRNEPTLEKICVDILFEIRFSERKEAFRRLLAACPTGNFCEKKEIAVPEAKIERDLSDAQKNAIGEDRTGQSMPGKEKRRRGKKSKEIEKSIDTVEYSQILRSVLTALYYKNLTLWQKIRAPRRKKLFPTPQN